MGVGYSLTNQNSKRQDLPKFQSSGGGGGGWVGGWYYLPSQNSKCQDLPKFQFLEGGGYSWALPSQNSSAKICLNFNFRGVGGGTICQVKTQSAKICLNFNFLGGGGWVGTL